MTPHGQVPSGYVRERMGDRYLRCVYSYGAMADAVAAGEAGAALYDAPVLEFVPPARRESRVRFGYGSFL